MSDRYQSLIQTPVGQLLAKNLGLPNPVRWSATTEGEPLVDGTVVVGGDGRLGKSLPCRARLPRHRLGRRPPTAADKYKGLVFDATGITSSRPLVALQRVLHPAAAQPRDLPARGRARHAPGDGARRRAGRPARARGLHPLARQGDRPRRHRAARLRRPRGRRRARLHARPSCSPPSRPTSPARWSGSAPTAGHRRRRGQGLAQPLAGKVALVTGASRGIGEQIARVLHRDGATVLGVDVPQAASELQAVTARARTATTSPSTSPPRTRRSGSPTTSRRSTAASTSSCTTPASPATRGWPT